MERRGSCWVRPSDKRGLGASKAVFTSHPRSPPPPVRVPCSLSSLLSPWTEDWHSVEDTPGWQLKEVELMCELSKSGEGGAWGTGHAGWGGVWSVVASDWVSFWWSADMADSPSAFPPPPLLFYSSLSISLSLSSAPLLGSSPLPPIPRTFSFLPSSQALLSYISSFRLLWLLRPRADPSHRRMMGSSPSYRSYLLSASIHITFLWLWEDGFHIGPLYWLAI